MTVDAKLEGDLNTFYTQLEGGVGKLMGGAAVDSSVIFNGTAQPVTFYAYNYIDNVYWVAAQKSLVAPGKYGTVAASGRFFKIHPNDNKDEEYLVEPGQAYIYGGPGDFTKADKKS